MCSLYTSGRHPNAGPTQKNKGLSRGGQPQVTSQLHNNCTLTITTLRDALYSHWTLRKSSRPTWSCIVVRGPAHLDPGVIKHGKTKRCLKISRPRYYRSILNVIVQVFHATWLQLVRRLRETSLAVVSISLEPRWLRLKPQTYQGSQNGTFAPRGNVPLWHQHWHPL